VLLVRVNAAVGNQPEKMKLATPFARSLHRLHNRRVLLKFSRRDLLVDSRDVHLHNPAGADVQVAHFAVAHLPIRKPDEMLRGPDQRIRELPQQLVIRGLARQRDGIVLGLGSVTPAVEDGKDKRTLGHEESILLSSGVFSFRINGG